MSLVDIERATVQFGQWFPAWPEVALVVATAMVITAVAARRRGADLPYVAANSLLTPAERAFFVVLQRALADDYQLFAKVRLGDLLQVDRRVGGKKRSAAFGRISSKHADFVVCDPRTFAVVGIIELDDRSHARADRQERDRFFDAAFAKAGLPVLRVAVQRAYLARELREVVREAFEQA